MVILGNHKQVGSVDKQHVMADELIADVQELSQYV
jgi:hypothetical protein